MLRKIGKIILWVLISAVVLVIAAAVALYIPAVQNFAKDIAIREVSKSTGMNISLDRLRLNFPLNVALEGVTVIEATGDTMVTASSIAVDVKFLPLLKGEIDVASANLRHAFYQMGTPDSAMWLRARVDRLDADGVSLNLKSGDIDLDRAKLNGAKVRLIMNDSIAVPTDTASATTPMKIRANEIELRNVDYTMSMLPIIDSLSATVPLARLTKGFIDTGRRLIDAESLSVDSVSALYLLPTADYTATHPAPTDTVAPTPDSLMWDITARKIELTGRTATYAVRGAEPLPGLDMNYLQAKDIAIRVDSFYNRGTQIRVPLTQLSATERSGIKLNATGLFTMDSVMHARNFNISTAFSTMQLNAAMGMGDLTTDSSLPLTLDAIASIGLADIELAYPSLGPNLRPLPRSSDLSLKADIDGTAGLINIRELSASLPGFMDFKARGEIADAMDFNKMSGQVDLNGTFTGLNRLKPTLLEAKVAHMVNIPAMTLKGRVDYKPGEIDGRMALTAAGGHMALGGGWKQRSEGYTADLMLDRFPVNQFLPEMGIGEITLTATASGHGYDPMSARTAMHVNIEVDEAFYMNERYSDVTADLTLADGHAEGSIVSNNPSAEIDVDLTANLGREGYEWDIEGDIHHLDLMAMKLSPTPNSGSLSIATTGTMSADARNIDASMTVRHVDWSLGEEKLIIPELKADLNASDSIVGAQIASGDINGQVAAFCPLDTLLGKLSGISAVLDSAIANKTADIRALQRAIPPMEMALTAGQSNFLTEYLEQSKMGFKSVAVNFHNDTLMSFNTSVVRFVTGDTKLDTITFGAVQQGKYLAFKGALNNRPGTLDQFAHVNLTGFLSDDKLGLLLRQRDIEDKQGFFLGMSLTMNDSLATLRFVPYTPTVGYKKWTLNSDNFISYSFPDRHIDANLAMQSDKSYIKVFTQHNPADTLHHHQEDLIVQLSDIHLSDWLSISPFAPPVKGDLGADLRIHWEEGQLTGDGTVSLNDLFYGRDRVGSFDIGLDVSADRSGLLRADASLMVDSFKVITATGVLNDTTSANPFMLDFSMIHFPLHIVNPFLPKDMAQMSGMLNGKMDITGSLTQPRFDGYLDFDSTAVKVGMLGTSFSFSEDKIPVDSSVVRFNNFAIKGTNDNPLRVDGNVDLRNLADINMDLTLSASDMQIVNSSRPRGADVYGKAFIDVDATVKGRMSLLFVDANLAVLPGTNVTYIVSEAESVIASQSTGEMVKFVQFSDSAAVAAADSVTPPSMAMVLNAQLDIRQGSTINVDLSADGKNRATIQGQGNLEYSMNPMNDGRLTGRFNINSGFVRYTPPMMSEKKFNFEEGSYVAFNGDMLNPILNIHAVDRMKANVTQSGQNSRLIDFDVSVGITNTLENMNVAFDLSTDDDITVQNELASMSPEQRANQAMNLLLYNTYTGPGTHASSSLSGNPLYSFLASQLNSWAANNIKGVDISFGIDQYDKTTDGYTSSTTSYSYRVSKSLFNDRFKIIVGGNYSTDADADENFSQNLINDIAFEYMLNRSGSMYVRIFRHTGFESILEGEITQTGVGFVLRRKINSLKDLFRWAGRMKRSIFKPKTTEAETDTPAAPDTTPTTATTPATNK